MPRMTRGANSRSKNPPIPAAPFQMVQISTREAAFCGVTVNVVTRFELMSDSVRTRPGSGLATLIRAQPPIAHVRVCSSQAVVVRRSFVSEVEGPLVPARLGEPVGEVVHRRGQVGEVGLPVELGQH